MLLRFMNSYTSLLLRLKLLLRQSLAQLVNLFSVIPTYYRLNDLLWQDGLLIDFLQKKVVDKWIRRFLVYSSYLFSERVLFEFVVRFYIDFVVWPMQKTTPFEFTSISMTLLMILSVLIIAVLSFNLLYLSLLVL